MCRNRIQWLQIMNKFAKIKDLIYTVFINHSMKTALNLQYQYLSDLIKNKDETIKVAHILETLSVNTMTVEAKNKLFLKYKDSLKSLIQKKQNINFIAYSLFLQKFEKAREHYSYFFSCLQKLYSPSEYEKLLTEVFLNLIRRRHIQGERHLEEDLFLFFGEKGIYKFLLNEKNFEDDYISTLHYLNEAAEPQYREKIVETYRIIFEKKQLHSALAHTRPKKVFKL